MKFSSSDESSISAMTSPSFSSWKEYTVRRRFRGSVYEITVKNPDGVCKGVREITMDGQPVAGNIIPCTPGEHKVTVTLG